MDSETTDLVRLQEPLPWALVYVGWGAPMAADARDLLRTLAKEDHRGTVSCAALCAASVAHLVPSGEQPTRRIEGLRLRGPGLPSRPGRTCPVERAIAGRTEGGL